MAPLLKLTVQALRGLVSTKSFSQKPCHNTQSTLGSGPTGNEPSIAAISWGFNRMDIYGNSQDSDNVTHQYWDGYQWGPAFNETESLGRGFDGPPTAVSANPGKMDIFLIGADNNIYHKYFDGSQWNPSATDFENLGGTQNLGTHFALAATAWAADRLDVFATGEDGMVYHKYYDGSSWQPQGTKLENLGGDFITGPAAVSWGSNRLDVFAVSSGRDLLHTYWDGSQWVTWEDLQSPRFTNTPTAISWGKDRLDVFGVDFYGVVWHLGWDGSKWLEREDLGGDHLTGTVAATSWSANRFDIIALGLDGVYYYKYWDGSQWNPQDGPWYSKGGSFSSVPELVSWSENRLDIFGVGTDKQLKHQTWYGDGWYPGPESFETLGGPLRVY